MAIVLTLQIRFLIDKRAIIVRFSISSFTFGDFTTKLACVAWRESLGSTLLKATHRRALIMDIANQGYFAVTNYRLNGGYFHCLFLLCEIEYEQF